ncbi:MAG: type IV toxin-antitoxin system AbiEi family antitoxin domain-containing protein, partial [Finegoldia magna]|nr:type IV toxin-antitoxin system AbiEi family antitoxin domain-containing protein [Finegoldia magna]
MSALSESILETIKSNGGTITIKEAEEKNISPKKLQRMVKQGSLERVTRGLYLHPEFLEDSYYIFQHRAPKAIFSHETALYLHKLSDENPHKIIATIPSGYNTSMIKER